MRDNSGQGKSSNNMRDPTLAEHAEQGGRKRDESREEPVDSGSGRPAGEVEPAGAGGDQAA